MNPPITQPPEVCPLCHQPNQCAMEMERATGQKQPPCWCTQASFSAELLARIPETARNQACVCASCARTSPESQRLAPP
ncbi:MAG: hypothetical protein CFE44_12450 [Burkholderiales bacterium PBB4]|nr:MAG: hypothetical protein CFE44_12450 [Burkholderiales bacterium PBB4]